MSLAEDSASLDAVMCSLAGKSNESARNLQPLPSLLGIPDIFSATLRKFRNDMVFVLNKL
ncbi:hypothetical protein, partial [Fulvivirga kasyanovii]|uniref:hypothetical protein n=1 Tax=Fulvivirga kasyanovii TaxID=396812 RepID=UPI001C8740D2